ncbi:demethylmenaquinone methyltransferase [Macrococcus armenti]|uniref:demethylmenaquinone methyltransferase n=1 Tax=Macrococcus armenti TaxID=2875764 RepID=UPI001CC987C6|nr:demethylmenaquinone methyltransferase [Macrococcus armenti]UBH07625.1 demethylmenaquinone methyltransferase [Macrococcus armenti]UBH09858.1 demethylmenaquinone methyltransferase [Macrococcus armenti]UBH14400.1 demethylmenaquinone methyltransferase [Macrococcus armenti]UBH16760.1 demethylmenaquinone methyltransferase [Macrococcus armenti]UBH19023.1 demethylmenaquinone methyltransferase [Macrococcus armenti]
MSKQLNGQEKSELVHNVFQNVSTKYDRLNDIISFNQHKSWRKYTMKQMDVKKGSKALDVCCGTGDWTIQMAQAVGKNGHVIGLDFSENMLSVAQEKTNHIQNIELIHGNAMALPFEDNIFDYTTIGFGLRNLPDYKKGLEEMYRVLKPGGMIVVLETSHPTMPVFKQGYKLYFKYVMPLFGKVFAKSMKEYSWLQQSAFEFPDKYTLAHLMAETGFTHIKFKGFTGGVSAMHLAYKPKAN